MILSPTMFRSMGWKGVAATTPKILLVGGVGFFGLCMAYQFVFAGQGGVAAAGVWKRGSRGGCVCVEGGGRRVCDGGRCVGGRQQLQGGGLGGSDRVYMLSCWFSVRVMHHRYLPRNRA